MPKSSELLLTTKGQCGHSSEPTGVHQGKVMPNKFNFLLQQDYPAS